MSKNEQLPSPFDIRLLPRSLRGAVLSRADLNKHLQALPDVAHKGVRMEPPVDVPQPVVRRPVETRGPGGLAALKPIPLAERDELPPRDMDDDEDDLDDAADAADDAADDADEVEAVPNGTPKEE